MVKLNLSDEEKDLLKSLSSVQNGMTDLMVFLKDNFFIDRLLLIDYDDKNVQLYRRMSSDLNSEVDKITHLDKVIKILNENDMINVSPFTTPISGQSVFWFNSTTFFKIVNGIQLKPNVTIQNGYLVENGKNLMEGIKLPNHYYEIILSWHVYVSINTSLKEYIENDFKTREEMKNIKENIGGGVLSAFRRIFGH